MQFKVNSIYYGFKLLEQQKVEEANSIGYLFEHEKTKAQLYYLHNDDDNKVFTIAFRTPPENGTGLPHILEHVVLAGSKKYPLKEPFVELIKGSLQTFLNAMTYPDKTVYPVASRNNADFRILMDVYLDAVFNPLIYDRPEGFYQEGWHYKINSKEDELEYNGVVYNEMKGAYSSPDSVLYREINRSLFPNASYRHDSGGDPEEIPNLTLKQFQDFHARYYHPSNSLIYLYGDGDILEHLQFINDEYLSKYEYRDVQVDVPIQQSFTEPVYKEAEYPLAQQDSEEDKSYFGLNFVVGETVDTQLGLSFSILYDILLGTSASPLKRRLLEEDIAKDIYGSFDNSIQQMTFSIIAKGTEPEKKDKFVQVVFDELQRLVNEGIDKRLIEGSINSAEFSLREADYGRTPKGLVYGLQLLNNWPYGGHPADYLRYEPALAEVKKALTEAYFEEMIQKYFLNNNHRSLVLLKPRKGLAEAREQQVYEELKTLKASLSEEELEKLIEQTQRLRKLQTSIDPPEVLAKIPLVDLADVKKEVEKYPLDIRQEGATKVIAHPIETNGIAYVNALFDTSMVPEDLLPYMSLLTRVLGRTNTKNYRFEELVDEIRIHTGGIGVNSQTLTLKDSAQEYLPSLVLRSRALIRKLPELMNLTQEIVVNTLFDDERRIKEVIQETRSRLESQMINRGDQAAARRLKAYYSQAGRHSELTQGVAFYKFLQGLEKNFEQEKDKIIAALETVAKMVLNRDNLLISVTLSDQDYPEFVKHLPTFVEALPQSAGQLDTVKELSAPASVNEGLKTAAAVQYVAKGGLIRDPEYKYTGAMLVARTMLGSDYLWNNIRVIGGAYGAGAQFERYGEVIFTSYRDPNLQNTLNVFDNAHNYLREIDFDQREMTKYILGTIGRLDTPLTPATKGEVALANYLRGITDEERQLERDQVLSVTKDDIRNLADLVKDAIDNGNHCVVGNEGRLEREKDLFGELVSLSES